jgi:hypothetical protein
MTELGAEGLDLLDDTTVVRGEGRRGEQHASTLQHT